MGILGLCQPLTTKDGFSDDRRPTTDDGFMTPAEQLQRLYLAGFDLQTFDRYPKHVGVVRDGCIALLRVTDAALRIVGAPGWRMGEVMGVLVEKEGRQVFQAKDEIIEATPERLCALARFREELDRLLSPAA